VTTRLKYKKVLRHKYEVNMNILRPNRIIKCDIFNSEIFFISKSKFCYLLLNSCKTKMNATKSWSNPVLSCWEKKSVLLSGLSVGLGIKSSRSPRVSVRFWSAQLIALIVGHCLSREVQSRAIEIWPKKLFSLSFFPKPKLEEDGDFFAS